MPATDLLDGIPGPTTRRPAVRAGIADADTDLLDGIPGASDADLLDGIPKPKPAPPPYEPARGLEDLRRQQDALSDPAGYLYEDPSAPRKFGPSLTAPIGPQVQQGIEQAKTLPRPSIKRDLTRGVATATRKVQESIASPRETIDFWTIDVANDPALQELGYRMIGQQPGSVLSGTSPMPTGTGKVADASRKLVSGINSAIQTFELESDLSKFNADVAAGRVSMQSVPARIQQYARERKDIESAMVPAQTALGQAGQSAASSLALMFRGSAESGWGLIPGYSPARTWAFWQQQGANSMMAAEMSKIPEATLARMTKQDYSLLWEEAQVRGLRYAAYELATAPITWMKGLGAEVPALAKVAKAVEKIKRPNVSGQKAGTFFRWLTDYTARVASEAAEEGPQRWEQTGLANTIAEITNKYADPQDRKELIDFSTRFWDASAAVVESVPSIAIMVGLDTPAAFRRAYQEQAQQEAEAAQSRTPAATPAAPAAAPAPEPPPSPARNPAVGQLANSLRRRIAAKQQTAGRPEAMRQQYEQAVAQGTPEGDARAALLVAQFDAARQERAAIAAAAAARQAQQPGQPAATLPPDAQPTPGTALVAAGPQATAVSGTARPPAQPEPTGAVSEQAPPKTKAVKAKIRAKKTASSPQAASEPAGVPTPAPVPASPAAGQPPSRTARFIGYQEAADGAPPFPLYNVPIEGGQSTTVSAETLRQMGVDVPETPPEQTSDKPAGSVMPAPRETPPAPAPTPPAARMADVQAKLAAVPPKADGSVDMESRQRVLSPEMRDEQIQMLEDIIATNKELKRPVQQVHLDRLAELKAQRDDNATPEEGLIASDNTVFGHPEATNLSRYSNLIPIKVRDVATLDRFADRAQAEVDRLQTKRGTAEAQAKGRIAATKKEKAAAVAYLRSANGVEDEVALENLKTQTLPELQRLRREMEKRPSPLTLRPDGTLAGMGEAAARAQPPAGSESAPPPEFDRSAGPFSVEYGTRSRGGKYESFDDLDDALDFYRGKRASTATDYAVLSDANGAEFVEATPAAPEERLPPAEESPAPAKPAEGKTSKPAGKSAATKARIKAKQEKTDAVPQPGAAQEVPRDDGARRDVAEGRQGVGPGEQGAEAARAGEAEAPAVRQTGDRGVDGAAARPRPQGAVAENAERMKNAIRAARKAKAAAKPPKIQPAPAPTTPPYADLAKKDEAPAEPAAPTFSVGELVRLGSDNGKIVSAEPEGYYNVYWFGTRQETIVNGKDLTKRTDPQTPAPAPPPSKAEAPRVKVDDREPMTARALRQILLDGYQAEVRRVNESAAGEGAQNVARVSNYIETHFLEAIWEKYPAVVRKYLSKPLVMAHVPAVAQYTGRWEHDVANVQSKAAALKAKAAERRSPEQKFGNDLRTTGVAYLENGARYQVQGMDGDTFGLEYTSPDRTLVKLLGGNYKSHDAAIADAVEHAFRGTMNASAPAIPADIPTVEEAQKAVDTADAEFNTLRNAWQDADNAAKAYAKEHDLLTTRRTGRRWSSSAAGSVKKSAPKAAATEYQRLQKLAREAQAKMENHQNETERPAKRALERANYAKVARDPQAPEVSRLVAQAALIGPQRDPKTGFTDTKSADALEARAEAAAAPMARELYPDATDEEVKALAPEIVREARGEAMRGNAIGIEYLRNEATRTSALQLGGIRRRRIMDALQKHGIDKQMGSSGRWTTMPTSAGDMESNLPEAFTTARSDIMEKSDLTAADVDAFIASIPGAVKAAENAQKAKQREDEKAEKAKAAEQAKFDAEARATADKGRAFAREWKPPFKGATHPVDALGKLAKPSSRLPILQMVAVKDGVGSASDLDVTVQAPIPLPDGVYRRLPGSDVLIIEQGPEGLEEMPPVPPVEKPVTVNLSDGREFMQALKAAQAAASGDVTREQLMMVWASKVNDGALSVAASDGRRLTSTTVSADASGVPDGWTVGLNQSAVTALLSDPHGESLTIEAGQPTFREDGTPSSPGAVRFSNGNTTITARLPDVARPDFAPLLAHATAETLTVDRKQFNKALATLKKMAGKVRVGVVLGITRDGGTLTLTVKDSRGKTFSETVPVEVSPGRQAQGMVSVVMPFRSDLPGDSFFMPFLSDAAKGGTSARLSFGMLTGETGTVPAMFESSVEELPKAPDTTPAAAAAWEPDALKGKPAKTDDMLRAGAPKGSTLPILMRMHAKGGVGRTTDLDNEVESPTSQPDGLWEARGNTWVEAEEKAADFPEPRKIGKPVASFTMKGTQAKAFKAGLLAAQPAQSTDETRYVLNGVMLEVGKDGAVSIVATDGRRLHLATAGTVTAPKGGEAVQMILTAQTVKLLLQSNGAGPVTVKLGTTEIDYTDDQGKKRKSTMPVAEIADGNVTLRTKLIESTYPNFRQVIPDPASQKIKLRVNRKALGQALADVRPYVGGDPQFAANVAMRLEASDKEIVVRTNGNRPQYTLERTVPVAQKVSVEGEPISMGVNPDFLLDIMKSGDSETVEIGLTDELSPVTVASEDGTQKGVLMPMRLTARGGGELITSAPRGVTRAEFDATLADETAAVPFAAENVTAGRYDDDTQDGAFWRMLAESGEGHAADSEQAWKEKVDENRERWQELLTRYSGTAEGAAREAGATAGTRPVAVRFSRSRPEGEGQAARTMADIEIRKRQYREARGEQGPFHNVWDIYDKRTGAKLNGVMYSSEAAARSAAQRLLDAQGRGQAAREQRPWFGEGPVEWWHGTASQDLRGGTSGLHIGTHEAAKQALEATIGIRADGKDWDGTTEYGDTLLMGRNSQRKMRETQPYFGGTGFNAGTQGQDIPAEDFYARDLPDVMRANYSNSEMIPLSVKPMMIRMKIVGPMTNRPWAAMTDSRANSTMKAQLKRGTAKKGYYYINDGEDSGSVSAVVPSERHVARFHFSRNGQVRAITYGNRTHFFINRYDNLSQLRGDIREEAGHRLVNELGGRAWSGPLGIGRRTYRGRWSGVAGEIERNYGYRRGTPEFTHELIAKAFRDGQHDVGLLRRFMDAVVAAFRKMMRRVSGGRLATDLTDAEVRNFLRGLLEAKARGATPASMMAAGSAARTPQAFYSALTEAVKSLPENFKAPGAMFRARLEGLRNKGRAWKQQESEESGFADWLAMQRENGVPVTREAALAFLDGNGVRVEAVTKQESTDKHLVYRNISEDWGEPVEVTASDYRAQAEVDGQDVDVEEREDGIYVDGDRVAEVIENEQGTASAPKFSQYATPGGVPGTYREVLLTVPTSATAEERWGSYDERMEGEPMRRADYRSPHWSEPNVIAHMLMDERRIPLDVLAKTQPELAAKLRAEGKTEARALHMIEGQSDWMQSAQSKGFAPSSARIKEITARMLEIEDEQNLLSREKNVTSRALGYEWTALKAEKEGVPRGPFKGDAWKRLVVRKMLAEAVAADMDLLTWSTGEDRFKKWGSQRVDWKKVEAQPVGVARDYRIEQDPAARDVQWRIVDRRTGQVMQSGLVQRDAAEQLVMERRFQNAPIAGEGPLWTVSAQEQTGGEHGGMNIEEAARERGVLLESKGQTVRTKEDLRRVIESIKRGDETNVEKLTDRIWDRMQAEPEGTSLPRKEFFEFLYDTSFRNEASAIVKKMDKGAVVGRTEWVSENVPNGYGDTELSGTVHAIPITDSIKSAVAQGLPLYAKSPPPAQFSVGPNVPEDSTQAWRRYVDEHRKEWQAEVDAYTKRYGADENQGRPGGITPAYDARGTPALHAAAQRAEQIGKRLVLVHGLKERGVADEGHPAILISADMSADQIDEAARHELFHAMRDVRNPDADGLVSMLDRSGPGYARAYASWVKSHPERVRSVVDDVAKQLGADNYAALDPDGKRIAKQNLQRYVTDELVADFVGSGTSPGIFSDSTEAERLRDVIVPMRRYSDASMTDQERAFAQAAAGGASIEAGIQSKLRQKREAVLKAKAADRLAREKARTTDRIKAKLAQKRDQAGLPPIPADKEPVTLDGVLSSAVRLGEQIEKEKGRLTSLQYAVDKGLLRRARETKLAPLAFMRDAFLTLEHLADRVGRAAQDRQDPIIVESLRRLFGPENYAAMWLASHHNAPEMLAAVTREMRRLLTDHYADGIDRIWSHYTPNRVPLSGRPGAPVHAFPNKLLEGMTPDGKRAMQAWLARIPVAPRRGRKVRDDEVTGRRTRATREAPVLAGMTTEQMAELYDEAREIIAQSRLDQDMLAQGQRLDYEQASEQITEEVESSNPDRTREGLAPDDTRRSTDYMTNRGMWLAATHDRRSVGMELGDAALRNGEAGYHNERMDAMDAMDAMLTELGYGLRKRIAMQVRRRPIRIAGKVYRWTDVERMDLAAQVERDTMRFQSIKNGIKLFVQRGSSFVLKGETDAEAEQIVQDVLDTITPAERRIINEAKRRAADMAVRGNETSMLVFGKELFGDPGYVVGATVERVNAAITDADADAGRVGVKVLENAGFTKSLMAHNHPIMIGNFFLKFDQHADAMARFIHLTVPLRAIRRTLHANDGRLIKTLNDRMGLRWVQNFNDMQGRLAGMDQQFDRGTVGKTIDLLTRNVARSLITSNPTTYARNRVPGSVLGLAWMAQEHPAAAVLYSARMAAPVSLHTRNSKDALAAIKTNGYMRHRWTADIATIMAPIAERVSTSSTSGPIVAMRETWKRIEHRLPFNPRNAELKNAVSQYWSLRGSGLTEAAAVAAVARLTQETQNSSSDLDDGRMIADLRRSSYGGVMAFASQDVVAGNFVLNAARERRWGALLLGLMGLLLSLVASAAVTLADRYARGKAKTDAEREKARRMAAINGVVGVLDAMWPKSRLLIDPVVEAVGGMTFGQSGMMLIDRPLSGVLGGIGKVLRDAKDAKPVSVNTVERVVMDALTLSGAPVTGGRRLVEYGKSAVDAASDQSGGQNPGLRTAPLRTYDGRRQLKTRALRTYRPPAR